MTRTPDEQPSNKPAVDEDWYNQIYPDCAPTGLSAAEHYESIGRQYARTPRRPDVQPLPPLVDIEQPRLFPDDVNPRFSIIVSAYNHWDLTRNALVAIADRTDHQKTSYEVLLADDRSTDSTTQAEILFPGLRRIVNAHEQRGFVTNNNCAAAEALGDYIVLLNNDTEVQEGWLAAIDRMFQRNCRIGIVGAKLVLPDGILQEAGSSLYRHGGTRNKGLGNDPNLNPYCIAHVTDYVSGACLAIPRKLWQQLGGFDEQFAPAYYEDVDLALRCWNAGYSVYCEPACVVMHRDGGSMSTTRVEQSERNRALLTEKWASALSRAPVPQSLQGPEPDLSTFESLTQSGILTKIWRGLPLPQTAKNRLAATVAAILARPPAPVERRQTPESPDSTPVADSRVTVVGMLQSGLGVGEVARLDVLTLDDLGFAPARIDLSRWMGSLDLVDPSFETTLVPERGPVILRLNPSELEPGLALIEDRIAAESPMIGCWAWELSRIPDHWKNSYRLIDELWVLSEFSATAFRDSCPVPVHVVTPPVRIPPTAHCSREHFQLPADATVFLSMCDLRSGFDRKNVLGAVNSFLAACGDDPHCILVLKVHHVERAPENMDRVREAIGSARNVRIINKTLSRGEIGDLIRAADVFLSPHRAEGFGLVIAEAMQLGKAVIATGYSGNMDFMPEGTAETIPYSLVPLFDPSGIYDGYDQVWAEPNPVQLAEAVARVASSESWRRQLGDAAAEFCSQFFSAENYRAQLSRTILSVDGSR